MPDRRLVYTVEIDATKAEATGRKLREMFAQIAEAELGNGRAADPMAAQVKNLKEAEQAAVKAKSAIQEIGRIDLGQSSIDELRTRLDQLKRDANEARASLERMYDAGSTKGGARTKQQGAQFQQLVSNVRQFVDDDTANKLAGIGYAPQAWINAEKPPEHAYDYDQFFQQAAADEGAMSGNSRRMGQAERLAALELEAQADQLAAQAAAVEKALAQRRITQIAERMNTAGDDEVLQLMEEGNRLAEQQGALADAETELMAQARRSMQAATEEAEQQRAQLARNALSETGDIDAFAGSRAGAGATNLNIGVRKDSVTNARELTATVKDQTEALREQAQLYTKIATTVGERYEKEHSQIRQTNAERQRAEREIAEINRDATTGAAASRAAQEKSRATAAEANKEKEALRSVTYTAKAEADERTAYAKASSKERMEQATRETLQTRQELAKQTAAARQAAAQAQTTQRRTGAFGPGSMLGQMFSPQNLLYGAAGALGIYSADQIARQTYGAGREGAQQIRQQATFEQFAGRLGVDANTMTQAIKRASNETLSLIHISEPTRPY